jgi:Ca2+-binding EF-hand superfamily protein
MKEQFMLVFDDELATEIIDLLDSDHSGSIGFAEFAKYIMGDYADGMSA